MSQIKIEELSKTELKEILTEKNVKFDSDAKHPELIDLVTKTLGSDTIDDGLSDPNPEDESNATPDEEAAKDDSVPTDEKADETVETPAEKKAREKAEKKAAQVKRVPWEYIVKSNLKIDGQFYKAWETIELDESQAEGLLADGTIE